MQASGLVSGELLSGRYELGARLGEGGMGVVYQAHDRLLGRSVAIKIFRDGAADDARTGAETRMLAGLSDASLVMLFDAQLTGESPKYLVMEFVDGPTLREVIGTGALTSHDVAQIAADLGNALCVVHAAGIVHRDVKPSNVLLRRSSAPGERYRAKLADFGIAHLVDATRLTAPGMYVGSAAYLSPEQVKGADPACPSDIYSLGLVLIECLTGKRVFAQTGVHEAALARLTADPRIPADIGTEWRVLLAWMTAREPFDRPTAGEVVDAVRRMTHRLPDAVTAITVADAGVGYARDEATVSQATLVAPPLVLPPPLPPPPPLPATRSIATTAHTAGLSPTAVIPRDRSARRAPRRWQIGVAALICAVAVAVGGLTAWSASTAPRPAVTLPALPEPLQAHLQQLREAVTP